LSTLLTPVDIPADRALGVVRARAIALVVLVASA